MWKYTSQKPRYLHKRSASMSLRWRTNTRTMPAGGARSPRGGAYLGVPSCSDAFTPSTRLVSIRRGRAISDRVERPRRAAQVRRPRRLGERYKRSEGVVRRHVTYTIISLSEAALSERRGRRFYVTSAVCLFIQVHGRDWGRNRCSCRLGVAQFHHRSE